jgi:hypothetical protein
MLLDGLNPEFDLVLVNFLVFRKKPEYPHGHKYKDKWTQIRNHARQLKTYPMKTCLR